MIKKVITVVVIIIIPVMAAIYGFQFGTKQVTVSAAEPKEDIKVPGMDKGFSESENMIRKIVWKQIRLKETIHDFEYTSENAVHIKTGFTSLDKDLKKTFKLIKELETNCGEVVDSYLITFIENGYKKMLELEFSNEVLSGLDLKKVKPSDLINLATNSYLDESLTVSEQ